MRHEDATLLTGDQQLRRAAAELGVEVHGVQWLFDLLRTAGESPLDLLLTALETWRDDPAVFLPSDEIESRLRGRAPADAIGSLLPTEDTDERLP